jgi:hypothetical protein
LASGWELRRSAQGIQGSILEPSSNFFAATITDGGGQNEEGGGQNGVAALPPFIVVEILHGFIPT